MEIHWNYCADKDGTKLLLVNGRVYKVKNLDEAFDLLQRFIAGGT
jgi:hypothetical protein